MKSFLAQTICVQSGPVQSRRWTDGRTNTHTCYKNNKNVIHIGWKRAGLTCAHKNNKNVIQQPVRSDSDLDPFVAAEIASPGAHRIIANCASNCHPASNWSLVKDFNDLRLVICRLIDNDHAH